MFQNLLQKKADPQVDFIILYSIYYSTDSFELVLYLACLALAILLPHATTTLLATKIDEYVPIRIPTINANAKS